MANTRDNNCSVRTSETSGNVPNAETIEAIKEVQLLKADPSLGKTYTNVNQMMDELLAD